MSLSAPQRHVPDGMILALVCAAQFMVVLDVSVVNVALPSIGRELHYTAGGLQWVVNAYVLTFAGFLLLGGRIADLFGRRRVFIGGLALFSIASLLGGLAQTSTELTIARAVQGVGGAVLSPATLTVIMTTFAEGKARHRALGMWSAVAGAGGAFGGIIGGVLTNYLSWRWVLFVNVPIGAAAVVAAVALLTETHRREATRDVDVSGAVLATVGLATVVYAIVGTTSHPWGSARTIGLLAAGIVLLGAFLFSQARLAKAPLMPLSLFRSRSVSGANAVMLLSGIAFFSMWYFLSLYLQEVHGYGPLKAGLLFLPMSGAIIIGAQTSARLVTRVGVRPVLTTGLLLATGGFLWLADLGAASGYVSGVLGGSLLTSLGMGLSFTPLATAATAGVPMHQAGLASGVLNTSRQVGGSLGLAILATIATDRTHALLSGAHAGTGAALTAGYDRAFLAAAVVMLVAAAVAALAIPALRRTPEEEVRTAVGTPTPVLTD